MHEDCRRHNRTKIRDLLSRLCRWYGADEVINYVPESDEFLRMRVKNAGKIENRKKRQRDAASKASSDVSAPVSNFSIPSKHKRYISFLDFLVRLNRSRVLFKISRSRVYK